MSISPTTARPTATLPLRGPSGHEQITARFIEHAASNPAAVALRCDTRTWSYGELDALSAQLAATLQRALPHEDACIGLYTRRSAAFVIGLLGALRSGRPVVLLDVNYPAAKVQQQIEQAALALLLHEDALNDAASAHRHACPGLMLQAINLRSEGGAPALTLSRTQNPAYLLFTSGTVTGPRLVAAGHAPLVHFVEFATQTFAPAPGTRFSLLSGLGHDPVLRDVFLPLSTGGELCIPPQFTLTDACALYDWVAGMQIAFMHATPPLQLILELGARNRPPLRALRYVFSGGDKLKARHREILARIAPTCQLVNYYGATETPQAVAWHIPGAAERDPIPIGTGIADTQVLVLDDALALCDTGTEGQIAVRSHYQSSSTAVCVLPDDLATVPVPVYLTGDYGYVRADGAVVLLGRRDDQVKIRAFRVDLNEIVSALEAFEGVEHAAVMALAGASGEERLVACVQADPARAITDSLLRQGLSMVLPVHMVPSQYRFYAQLPLLPNGKIDRSALRAALQGTTVAISDGTDGSGANTRHSITVAMAADDVAAAIARAWQRLLLLEDIPVRASFATLGGDSLSFIQASMDLELILGHLPPRWETVPLGELAMLRNVTPGAARSIDSTVLVRALSITLIVLGHTDFLIVEGTTTTLFVIAGMSFGRYQLPTVLQQDSIRPIVLTMLAVAIPSWIWKVCLLPSHPGPHWQSFVFLGNLVSPELDAGLNNWFVDVYLQILLGLTLLFACPPARRLMRLNPYATGLACTCGAVLAAGLIHRVWNTAYLADWVPHLKLWLVLGGVTLLYVERSLQYAPLLLLLVLGTFFHQFTLYALSCLLLVSQTRRLPVPYGLVRSINEIASASLIIYLTHNEVRHRLLAQWPHIWLPLSIAICIVVGVGANLAWTRLFRHARFALQNWSVARRRAA